MKKRFSFCVKVGLGIGTIGILGFRFAIFDFRFPASKLEFVSQQYRNLKVEL